MPRPSKKQTDRAAAPGKKAASGKKAAPGKKLPASKGGPASRRPAKRQLAEPRVNIEQGGERLQKVLAAAGVASRREAEQLILEGRVEVDGQTITELGTRVDRASQTIQVDGEPLPNPKLVYFAVNKPEGVVCTASDPAGRTRVTDLLPSGVGRVFNVGRLDITSEGLILVTNDGELANQLTHPRHGVEKTYEVQVAGHLDAEVLKQLHKGVHLAEGFAQVVHARIKSRRKNGTVLEMVLDEGRNREIRRLLAKVGHRVQRLKRIAVGPVRLGEMPKGSSRKLTPDEVRKLQEYVLEAEKNPRKRANPKQQQSTRQGSLNWRQRKQNAAAGKAAGKATGGKVTKPTQRGKGK